MKLLKLIALSIIIFLLLLTFISLFIPSHVRVSRAINIPSNKDSILYKISNLSTWREWYPGFEQYVIKDSTIKAGRTTKAHINGICLLVLTFNDTLVNVQMTKGNRAIHNTWRLIKYNPKESLTLQNYIDFYFQWYPWEKFSSLLLDKSYGNTMENGLKKLATNTVD